jgi:hypothetical protein
MSRKGDIVQITDPEGEVHNMPMANARDMETHKGWKIIRVETEEDRMQSHAPRTKRPRDEKLTESRRVAGQVGSAQSKGGVDYGDLEPAKDKPAPKSTVVKRRPKVKEEESAEVAALTVPVDTSGDAEFAALEAEERARTGD